jgi:hypothetical protein
MSEDAININLENEMNSSYKNYSKPASNPIESVTANNLTIGTVNVSASITSIPPSQIISDGFEFSNSDIIPSELISGSYAPQDPSSSIELFIYDLNKNVITNNYNYTNWEITKNTEVPNIPTTFTNDQGLQQEEISTGSITTDLIQVNPAGDAYELGIDSGEVYVLYNFLTNELGSSNSNPFYIAEISSDRTEIRLKSNTIENVYIREGYAQLKSKLDSFRYFDEFYINFYNNVYSVGINCLLDDNLEEGPSILIKTFTPIPINNKVGDKAYVVTKQSETLSWQVDFYDDFSDLVNNATYIKGPNINISLQDLVNNSTTLKSKSDLLNTKSSESLDSVLNVLNQKGVTITPNYSYNTFDQFINFSSAKERINNFYEKVSQIQAYQADIDVITTTTGSNPNVSAISQSLASLQTNISNLVENFDGYENYLYYNSSSFAYPKTGSAYPYSLQPTGSTEVLEWMGSDVEGSQYYGGIILSASLYDEDNQNWLYYTIPSFITENSDNDEYVSFSNMVGQSFDEVWLYTKALSERYNTTNNPDTGLPLGLAADAIKGLGFETFGNNYNNQDNFIGLTGEDNGDYVPPTGSELITKYVAINSGSIVNYWDIGYSWLNYVEQLNEAGFPYAIDKVSKEIYKRLYHNMAYLTKKKGTISGLRQLINIWGIPNTILRINEFGGKNRDNTDDYDLWYKRYSYAYTPVANSYAASSSVRIPWMPLERNYIADSQQYIVPDGIALRFKTFGHPSSSYGGSYYSQSIAVKKSNGTADDEFDWGIGLYYEDQPSGSYSGSSFSDYYDYGKLRFYISSSQADGGVQISNDIELPFFDGGWWTVLLQRDQHVSASDNSQGTIYTLYAANKIDNGWDGNSIGWTGSVSINSKNVTGFIGYDGGFYEEAIYEEEATVAESINEAWNRFGVTEYDGVYVGGYVSGSKVMTEVLNEGSKIFSGSLQEFRYYSNNIAKTVFNDFVMNPESIEGNNITGSESSFDIVNFRAPLGNELEYTFTSSYSSSYTENISSSHPSITGSAPLYVVTQSFRDPLTGGLTSSYEFIHYSSSTIRTYSKTNVETYFLDQPSIGIRNRVSNKIQVEDGEVYGNVLSKYRSIQQNYLISESYTEDISSLEVGFSPQDEVNDDIVASFGYGVISDTLADPRFAFSGSQTYYPKLRSIANDYFKKYTEGNVWDYLRLIKYFDNSIFKAIKSYVPARTSVTTGVIVKQHMLERNRRVPVTVDPNTIIAYTPETGSVVGGQSTATGNNSPISYRNLEITGSLNVGAITGSNGGVPPNLEGQVSASGPGFNIVAVTQSWSGSNQTISGSVPYVDQTQTEFFNGEYSGSEFIATTQSLLNNPFAPSQTLNTSYNIQVTTSLGKYLNLNFGFNQYLNTYPSFSLNLETKVFDAQTYDQYQDQIDIEIEGWYHTASLLTGNGRNKALLALVQYPGNPEYFFIYNFSFPMEGAIVTGTTLNSSTTYFNGFFGTNQTGDLRTQYRFPLPPTESGGMAGILNGIYKPLNIGPYFKLDLNDSENPSSNGKFFQSNAPYSPSFQQSTELGNLDSNIIVSSVLGNEDNLTIKQISSPNQSYWCRYQWTRPEDSNQRPIQILDQNDNPIQFSNWSKTFNTSSIDPTRANPGGSVGGMVITASIMFSNYKYETFDSSTSLTSASYGSDIWYNALNSGSDRGLEAGTGSMLLVGTTWTGSYGDSGYYVPYGLMFSEYSYGTDGSLIDNINTLANLPSFEFDILNSSSNALLNGSPATVDAYNLSGSLFKQGLNKVSGLISINSPTFTKNSLGYLYNVLESRQLSGSAFSLSGQWTPTGSQDLQYVNFNPQLPPFDEFYNTPFNALINNVTQSRPNTYLQVVEYEGGSSTGSSGVPSNVIPISLGSAEKANIPDSFYTQKSSITSRYLGSKLQSANYNTFTPSGSKIQYLNGEISGSIFSGSNQSELFSCFVAGTQITTVNGSNKNIENIKIGETITTWNENTQKTEPGIVGDLKVSKVESIVKLTFEDGNIINTTKEHPFYVEGKNWITAANLVVGDVCKTINNSPTIISSIEITNESTTVYNLLSVAPNHNFYANGVLTHNKNTFTITSPVYGGDSSRGTMKSVNTPIGSVNKHPIYIAHYKSSKETPELFGTYTFDIDSLIQVPLEDITGDKAPILPTILKVDGSNDRLTDVRSTFEVDRKSAVSYNTPVQYISGSTNKIDYTTLPIGDNRIYQGGLEYQNIFTTQPAQNKGVTTASCFTCSWFQGFAVKDTSNFDMLLSSSSTLGSATGSSGVGFMRVVTGSAGSDSGEFKLTGTPFTFSGSWRNTSNPAHFYWFSTSPCLATVHSLNVLASMSIEIESGYQNNGGMPGIPQIKDSVDPNNPNSFWRYSPAKSADDTGENELLDYQDFGQNLIFKKGDEIRVEWNVDETGLTTRQILKSQVFTVIDVPPSGGAFDPPTQKVEFDWQQGSDILAYAPVGWNPSRLYNRLVVYPNPRDFNIPNDIVNNFTVRRRVNADDRVIIYQQAPQNVKGARTPSPSGYLIPSDMTPVQKTNVRSLITQLEAKSAFPSDITDNEPLRGKDL